MVDNRDSHYATASDGSVRYEFCNAICAYTTYIQTKCTQLLKIHSNAADSYTSGAEAYVQIQPISVINVSVEINTTNFYNTEKPDGVQTKIFDQVARHKC